MQMLLFPVYILIAMWPATILVIACSVWYQTHLAFRWLRKPTAIAVFALSICLQFLIPFVAIVIVKSIPLTDSKQQMSLPPEMVKVCSVAVLAEIVLFALSAGCLLAAWVKGQDSESGEGM